MPITKSKGHIQPSIHDSPELTAMWQSLAEAKNKPFGNERIETINRLTTAIRKAWIERGGNLDTVSQDGDGTDGRTYFGQLYVNENLDALPQDDEVSQSAFPSFSNQVQINVDPVKEIGSNLSAILGMLREHKPGDRSELDRHFAIVATDLSKIVAYWSVFVESAGKVENAKSS